MATITVIDNEEAFLDLRPEWDALVAANPKLRVFQTFDWCFEGWIRCYAWRPGASLFIVRAVRENHEEKAIFPFWLDGKGRLAFLMGQFSDVCDAIYAQHDSNWHLFYNDVIEFLLRDKRVRSIALSHLEADSECLAYFGVLWPHARVTRMDAYSFLSLKRQQDFPEGLGFLSPSDRSRLRKLLAQSTTQTFQLFSRENNNSFPRAELLALRQRMCDEKLRVPAFFPLEAFEVVSHMYEVGLCEIEAFVNADGSFEAAAFRLCNQQKSHINFWIMLYRNPRDTTLLSVRYMAEKLKERDSIFDFGTGAYSYKLGTFRPRVVHLFAVCDAPETLRWFVRDIEMLLRKYVKAWLKRLGFLKGHR